MFTEERLDKISELIRQHGRVTVSELSRKFKVSPVTIRRDLALLEERSGIKRTHGGAIFYVSEYRESSFDEKSVQHIGQKKRIAAAAAGLISEGDTVLLDGGSTNFLLARELGRFRKLKVITNSVPCARALRDSPCEILLIGGSIRKKSFSAVGPLAAKSLANYRANKCFIGTTGISVSGGLFSPSEQEAQIKQAALRHSRIRVIVADSSKAGVSSFARFADLSSCDILVTDRGMDKTFLKKIRKKVPRIIQA